MPVEELNETATGERPRRRRQRRHGSAHVGASGLPVNPPCCCGRHRHGEAFTRPENPAVTATGRVASCGGPGAGRYGQGHGETRQPDAAQNQD